MNDTNMTAKIRGGRGKHILREVLYRHVPKALVGRPKMGFGVPQAWREENRPSGMQSAALPQKIRAHG